MDGWQFTSSVIGSLAWPLAMLALGLLFREQVRTLLTKMKTLKGPGGIEASFTEQAKEVAAEAQRATIQRGLIAPREGTGPEEMTVATKQKLVEMLTEQPSAMILRAWEQIEVLMYRVLELADAKVPAGDLRYRNQRALIEVLFRDGLISEGTANILHKLYNLRNHVIHNDFEPELEAAADYYKTALTAVDILTTVKARLQTEKVGNGGGQR